MSSLLFEPIMAGNLEVPNRFMSSSTASGHGGDGGVSEFMIERCVSMGQGGVGIVQSGPTVVHPSGVSGPGRVSLMEGADLASFRRLTEKVHETGMKAAIQFVHPGRFCAVYQKSLGREAIAPSFLGDDPPPSITPNSTAYHEATEVELAELVEAFGDAAARAREAGFDLVQVHAAHDSLFSQFLSPLSNRRVDRWGGALENRMRLHLAVLAGMKKKTGEDFPVSVKLGVLETIPGGLEIQDGIQAALELVRGGCDLLEVSQGAMSRPWEGTPMRMNITKPEDEAYFRAGSAAVKKRLPGASRAVIALVGGIRSFEVAEELLEKGEADMVSFCRPLIREPGLPGRWKSGDTRRAACISCNKCAMGLAEGRPLVCYLESAS
jgi:2,4-dienoyl-CoA reductase-like NADH-dependent reductase (Old Yellow Enzyme family)